MTRGQRLNNLGNIRIGKPVFFGEVVPGSDSEFRQFDTVENGIRAIGKILLAYFNVHGLNTIREIIGRWAPPADNNPTDAYISNVAEGTGLDADAVLQPTQDIIQGITTAIIKQEQGEPAQLADVSAGVGRLFA